MPSRCAQLGQERVAAGEQLVGVALMADVKEQAVGAEVKDVVQGDGELDDAEVGREVAAGLGDLVADGLADFRRELDELLDRELFELVGALDGWK